MGRAGGGTTVRQDRPKGGSRARSRNLLPRLVGALALLVALVPAGLDLSFVERMRLQLWDVYQQLSPRPAPSDPVVVVDIDDESLRRIGQWAWPRPVIAEMIRRLNEAGAAAIGFDVVFAEPDRTSPGRLVGLYPDTPGTMALRAEAEAGLLPDHDALLAAEIARAPVVLGFTLTNRPGAAPLPPAKLGFSCAGSSAAFVPGFAGAVPNLPALQAAATGAGSFGLLGEADGIVRRVPLVVAARNAEGGEGCGALAPALSVETLRVAEGASRLILRASDASGETSFGAGDGLTDLVIGSRVVPVTEKGEMWVHFSALDWRARMVPAHSLLAADADLAALRERVAGRIVLVGTSAEGLQDLRSTPLAERYPGVLVHAEAIEQMQAGHFLTRPGWARGAEFTFLLLFGLLMIWGLPKLASLQAALLALGFIAAGPLASWFAFTQGRMLIDPVYPAGASLVLYLFLSASLLLREEREKGRVRTAFGRYLSPTLVERLAAHPEELRLGGETRELSVLFCDVRGFTTLSEGMAAEDLTRLLNGFLTPMTEIVMSRQGTIDKYIGDAIMAFWNAPLDVADHPRAACLAALDMQARLASLNPALTRAGLLPEGRALQIGIGINTGLGCVGNLGSEQRFDYSVLGDTVNTASRIEGQCKTYRTGIIVGPETAEAVADLALIEIDRIRLKGKATPLRIHGLFGDAALAASPSFVALREAMEAMHAAYVARDWDGAEAAVARARKLAAGGPDLTGLLDLYGRRIAIYREAPPGPGWDGVHVAADK